MSVVDAHLEIDPEQAIEFTLIDSTTTTTTTPQKVTLTLKHPDVDGLPIAFKVCIVVVVVMMMMIVVCLFVYMMLWCVWIDFSFIHHTCVTC